MTITNLPVFFDMIYSKSDGKLAADGYLYNDQMFQSLNNLLMMFNKISSTIFTNISSLEAVGINVPALLGINPPSFTTTQITAIVTATYSDGSFVVLPGTIWYNTDINKLQVLVLVSSVRTVQTITST